MGRVRKYTSVSAGILVTSMMIAFGTVPHAFALVGAHSHTDGEGEVFLGGDYIELGISNLGSFGTDNSDPIPGFHPADPDTEDQALGMSTNPTGFGVAPNLLMDFFLPGSPEERWVVGYKIAGDPTAGSNSKLNGASDIGDNTVTNQSSGDNLQALSVGTFNDKLKISQVYSFSRGDKFFKNEVTLKNVGDTSLDHVRYMRSFDPDNTVFQDGDYTTHNYIPYQQPGDGKAVVVADTNIGGETPDPVYQQNGSYSPILFYSSDARARVSTGGFGNDNPYSSADINDGVYDAVQPKDYSVIDDVAINIDFDVGTLAPGASQTVTYYTSLDNRDFSDVLKDIQAKETNIPNNGDANNDGIQDGTQTNVGGLFSSITKKYIALQAGANCTIHNLSTSSETKQSSQDDGYSYPEGLMNFTLEDCGAPGYTTKITQYYWDVNSSGLVARKYDAVTKKYTTVSGATITPVVIDGHHVLKVSYNLTDGGMYDQDGKANGKIVDPVGLAVLGAPNTGDGQSVTANPVAAGLTLAALIAVAAGLNFSRRQKV